MTIDIAGMFTAISCDIFWNKTSHSSTSQASSQIKSSMSSQQAGHNQWRRSSSSRASRRADAANRRAFTKAEVHFRLRDMGFVLGLAADSVPGSYANTRGPCSSRSRRRPRTDHWTELVVGESPVELTVAGIGSTIGCSRHPGCILGDQIRTGHTDWIVGRRRRRRRRRRSCLPVNM